MKFIGRKTQRKKTCGKDECVNSFTKKKKYENVRESSPPKIKKNKMALIKYLNSKV